jgi:hypothetical protein
VGKNDDTGHEAFRAAGEDGDVGRKAGDTFCLAVRGRGLKRVARLDDFIYALRYKLLNFWRNSHAPDATHFSNIGALDFGTFVRPGMD